MKQAGQITTPGEAFRPPINRSGTAKAQAEYSKFSELIELNSKFMMGQAHRTVIMHDITVRTQRQYLSFPYHMSCPCQTHFQFLFKKLCFAKLKKSLKVAAN